MYVYYNPNPRGNRIAGDCVIRALCKAFDAPWEDIYAALSVQGYMMGDWGNSDPVWGAYLRSKGFIRYALPNTCPDCFTAADFAKDHKNGVYVLGTGRHCICLVDGNVYDNWDSSDEPVSFYYERGSE